MSKSSNSSRHRRLFFSVSSEHKISGTRWTIRRGLWRFSSSRALQKFSLHIKLNRPYKRYQHHPSVKHYKKNAQNIPFVDKKKKSPAIYFFYLYIPSVIMRVKLLPLIPVFSSCLFSSLHPWNMLILKTIFRRIVNKRPMLTLPVTHTLYICLCVHARACVCVCACARARFYIGTGRLKIFCRTRGREWEMEKKTF